MEKNIINIDAHVIDDIRTIITRARNRAYQSINETLIRSNWEIGKRIVEEEQLGKQRADYGIQLIKSISQQLTTEFGSGYGVRNLAYFKQLYQYFPDWEILHARVQNLPIREILVQLLEIGKVTNPIAGAEFCRQLLRYGLDELYSIICTLLAKLLFFNNTFAYFPV